jgi:hypothetical protein
MENGRLLPYNEHQFSSTNSNKGFEMVKNNEGRRHDRYDTEAKIHFIVPYDLTTKVNFQHKKPQADAALNKRFSGITRNISAGGICFISDYKPERGDYLLIDLYLPSEPKPIVMEGEVKWSKATDDGLNFNTGVQLAKVSGKPVEESIYFDQDHQVIWSVVLDQVLGNFAILHKKIYPNA